MRILPVPHGVVISLFLFNASNAVSQIPGGSTAREIPTEVQKADARVDQIIERANDHFKKGKLALQDNKRHQARDEFDMAVDEILASGMDVRASKKLEAFYLDLVEKIYREEVPLFTNRWPPQAGFKKNDFDPPPLDPLSKLILTEDEKKNPEATNQALTKIRARKGDTIAKIAAARNVSPNELAKLNGIGATVELEAGQEIKVPSLNSSTTSNLTSNGYISATKEYEASLEKLLLLYKEGERRAQERLAERKLAFSKGSIIKEEVEASEVAVADAKSKVNQVQGKLDEVRDRRSYLIRRRAQEDTLLGSKPTQSTNGTLPIVKAWFQQYLHDPYSARYVHWSKVYRDFLNGGPCWIVRVRLRAKNAFAAYRLSDYTFCIRRNRIVDYEVD